MSPSSTAWWRTSAAGLILGLSAACGSPVSGPESAPSSTPSPPPAGSGSAPTAPGPAGAFNYRRVDPTVAGGGATPPEALAAIGDLGFVSVINLRTDRERGARVGESRAAAEAAGLKYFHLPFREPTAEIVETFVRLVTDPANHPVYVHCGSGDRVGALWLIKRVRVDGWTVEDARREADAIGLRSERLTRFVVEYVGARGG